MKNDVLVPQSTVSSNLRFSTCELFCFSNSTRQHSSTSPAPKFCRYFREDFIYLIGGALVTKSAMELMVMLKSSSSSSFFLSFCGYVYSTCTRCSPSTCLSIDIDVHIVAHAALSVSNVRGQKSLRKDR